MATEQGFDPANPEHVYRRLSAQMGGLRHEMREFERTIRDEVRTLSARRRFKAVYERGAGSVDDVLLHLLDTLESFPNQTETLQELRRYVDRNRLRDAIELGVEKGLLVVGVMSTGRPGQPPQILTLASNEARPHFGPPPESLRIRWEDQPLPEGMKPYRPRRKKQPPEHRVTVTEDGKVSVTKNRRTTVETPSQVEMTTMKCQHFPDGAGPCQPDCEAIFGSAFPDPFAQPEPPVEPQSATTMAQGGEGQRDPDEPAEAILTPVEEHTYDDDVWLSVGQPTQPQEDAADG